MKRNRKVKARWVTPLVGMIFLLFNSSFLYAYTDKIALPIEEVWPAALEALKPYRIRKQDESKKFVESRWKYDRVERSRGMLKKYTAQNYERRYRLKVQVMDENVATEIRITGLFQERPANSGPFAAWRKVKPDSQDYQVERDFFFKVLQQLENSRRR